MTMDWESMLGLDVQASATQALTRAYTCLEALRKLGLAGAPTLHLHFVGCDRVEADSISTAEHYLDPLIMALPENVRHVTCSLVGPKINPELHGKVFSALVKVFGRA